MIADIKDIEDFIKIFDRLTTAIEKIADNLDTKEEKTDEQ